MQITTCGNLADEGAQQRKAPPVSSGASCVNDGALRYGPRRLLWLVYRHFFVSVDSLGYFPFQSAPACSEVRLFLRKSRQRK
jgi:hypothetical protein